MRLHGICTECRQFKRVEADGFAVAYAVASSGIIQGVCTECEEEQVSRVFQPQRYGPRKVEPTREQR